ncbi:DUF4142 domain-containing protein [Chelativorans sp. AA-79]|uniref:DUF4142 domain-containing protein n=1 Tax=Chelativorans sp. AA-79 TaxID=3028735 RepID=UPI0023F7C5A9|nr:DUF4142 domain-containing protein [Chelativorans sp. AA-79]WEX09574.1 DUF4142 domain-containing protein [Chelativorans sp. AA-79]
MHRSLLLAAGALALAFTGPALSQDTTPTSPTEPELSDRNDLPAGSEVTVSTPQEFATMAAHSNMFEIESSRIALDKAQSDEVRQFAQRMVDDHTMAAEEMKAAAEADGVNDVPQTLDAAHQQQITELENASADQFDSQYVQMQVAAHQQAVALFSSYAEQEGALADFAEKTLPTLQEHLDRIQEIAQQ